MIASKPALLRAEWTRPAASIIDFPEPLVSELARLPGFRNILVHEYLGLDYDLVVRALDELEPIEQFLQIVVRRVDDESSA